MKWYTHIGNINVLTNLINPAIITKSFKKCSISNDLDGTEDDVFWAEQYDKSNTDSNKWSDNIYDDTQTNKQMFSEESDDDELFWFSINIADHICQFDSGGGGLLFLKCEYIQYVSLLTKLYFCLASC